jgi:hypothetical protein
MGLSSPNRIVWLYFAALRRAVLDLDSSDDDERKGNIAICITLDIMRLCEDVMNRLFAAIPAGASK